MEAITENNQPPFNQIILNLESDIESLQEQIERIQDLGMSAFKQLTELKNKQDQLDQMIKFLKIKDNIA